MSRKIIFITPSLAKGGAETQLIKVALYLKKQGYKVLIIALWNHNNFGLELKKGDISAVFLERWKTSFFKNLWRIYKTVKEYNPDTVIAFMFSAIIIARLLKLTSHFKLISSIRTSVLDQKWNLLFKITSSLDDIVIYNSKASKIIFENNRLIKRDGIVINNAIKIPLHIDDITSHRINKEKPFVWCTLAHFRPEKDYETLFKAIAILKKHNFRIDVLGHTTNQSWPFKMIKDLGIDNKVRILGFQKDVTPYLENADALVLSTHWEGSPNSILEAMAYSKPIVATGVPGIEDIINESKAGYLTQRNDENDLANKMLKIMSITENERGVLGIRGKKYVETSYAEDIVMKQWLSVIY